MKNLWRSGVVAVAVCAGAGVAKARNDSVVPLRGEVAAVSWEQVAQAADELTFVQRITGFALTCPEEELKTHLVTKPAMSAERVQIVTGVLAEAWLARNRGAALEFWKANRATLPAEIQMLFFSVLAESDAKAAGALLKSEEQSKVYPQYLYAVLSGMAKSDPEGAFKLAAAGTGTGESRGQAMMGVLGMIAQKNPGKAMELTAQLPEGEARRQAEGQVLAMWFGASPEAALTWADGAKLSDEAMERFSWTYADHAREHAEDAERWLAALKDERLKKTLSEAMLAQSTPAQLWSAAQRDGWKSIPGHSLGEMIEYAGSLKPAEAARLFKSIPVERLKDKDDVVKLTQVWAWLDGDAAAAWAEALPEGEMRTAAVLRMNTMWQLIDPKRAIAQIEAAPPGGLKAQLVRNVAVGLAKVNPAAAIDWVNTQTDIAGKEEALASLVDMGAKRNPEETAALLAKLNAGPSRLKAYETFSHDWAQNNPEDAMDWFLTLPAGAERTALSKRMMGEVAEKVPVYAAAMLGDVADPVEKTNLATALMATYVATNPDALPGILETIPQGEARNKAMVKALGAIAGRDPAAALGYLQTAELGAQKSDAVRMIGQAWAHEDPVAAARWVEGLLGDPTAKPDRGVSSAVGAVGRNWAATDPQAALAWLQKLPAGLMRLEATRGAVYAMSESQPARAFDAILGEPGLAGKNGPLDAVIKKWSEFDPEGAARRVRESTLPEATKTRLLSLKK